MELGRFLIVLAKIELTLREVVSFFIFPVRFIVCEIFKPSFQKQKFVRFNLNF